MGHERRFGTSMLCLVETEPLRQLTGRDVPEEELRQGVPLSIRESWRELPRHINQLPGNWRTQRGSGVNG